MGNEEFTLTENFVSHTFIGDCNYAYTAFISDEMANNNMTFMQWCLENMERVLYVKLIEP